MSNTAKIAAGFVLWRLSPEGHVYLLLRNAGHQTWGFPKGHLEAGEELLEGAKRELLEETQLSDIQIDETFNQSLEYEAQYDGGQSFKKIVRYFLAELKSSECVLSDEHDAGDWYDFGAAMGLLQHEDSRMLLTAAETILELEQH